MLFSTIVALGVGLFHSSYANPIAPLEGALSKRSVDKLPPGTEFVECRKSRVSLDSIRR